MGKLTQNLRLRIRDWFLRGHYERRWAAVLKAHREQFGETNAPW